LNTHPVEKSHFLQVFRNTDSSVQQGSLMQFAPLSLRLIVGILFIINALMKLVDLSAAVQDFVHLGVPLPFIAAPLIAVLELIGGLCLVLGIGTRVFSVLLTLDMLVAIITTRFIWASEFQLLEFQLALIAGLIALILSGPGKFALIKSKYI
jgi:putative oxidoreductase